MITPAALRVGYVMKVYPRFSETFIVNEILAHEAAGLTVDLFSLRPARDTHFQDVIARVRGGVTYLAEASPKAEALWLALRDLQSANGFAPGLDAARTATAEEVYAAAILARAVRERGLDHLHAHFASSATTVARIAARFAGITYSFTAHAKDIFHDGVNRDELRRKFADAAGAVTVSAFNAAYLHEICRPWTTRLRRVYNGLELSRFPFHSRPRDAAKVVAVGRLVEKKGFATLIDACSILVAKGTPVQCDIIGTGALESALRGQIARLGLESHVTLCGPLPQTAVAEAVAAASVLALPCVVGEDGNRDGLPTVLLEAMALGTPCVTTDVTGIPEVVTHERTGLVVAQHDAPGLAAAIERLMVDTTLRERLAAAARRRIETDFDSEKTAAELRDMFAACVESSKTAAAAS